MPDLEPVVPAEETTTEEEPHSAAPSGKSLVWLGMCVFSASVSKRI